MGLCCAVAKACKFQVVARVYRVDGTVDGCTNCKNVLPVLAALICFN